MIRVPGACSDAGVEERGDGGPGAVRKAALQEVHGSPRCSVGASSCFFHTGVLRFFFLRIQCHVV